MKLVIAYVQPFVGDSVVSALRTVPGVTGATFAEVRGFGRGHTVERSTAEALFGSGEHLRFEVAIADEIEDAVVSAITRAAHTGQRGDGKVFVLPVSAATRIATGETGTGVV